MDNLTSLKEMVWKCPTSGCDGYVSFIDKEETPYNDGKSFYGCGETGNMWYKKEDFYADIEEIIEKYSYRKECYMLVDGEWIPNNCNIDGEIIDKEEDRRWDYE